MSAASPVLFKPGRGIGLVRHPFLVLLDAGNAGFAEQMWGVLEDGGGIDELLEAISSGGIKRLGDFALAAIEDGSTVRVVVRGSVTASIYEDHQAHSVDAGTTRTWREETIEGVSRVCLRFGDETEGDLLYRAERGVLPAIELRWSTVEHGAVDFSGVTNEVDEAIAAEQVVSDSAGQGDASSPPTHAMEPAADVTPRRAMADEFQYLSENAAQVESSGAHEYHPDELVDERTVAGLSAPLRPPDPQKTQIPPPPPVAPSEVVDPLVTAPTLGSGGLISSIPGSEGQGGDHDGHTITRSEMERLRGQPQSSSNSQTSGPPILGQLCHLRHASGPHATHCRVCGVGLSGTITTVERPSLGTLTISTGIEILLNSPVVFGRNPKAAEGTHVEVPQLVRLDTTESAISRSHASIRFEGWQVLIDDLGSANGTTVTLPGMPARRLRAGEPLVLEDGATIDFAGEITVTFEANRG